MALESRGDSEALVFAIVAAINEQQVDSVASFFHADITSVTDMTNYKAPTKTAGTVTSADSTDEATAVTLVNELRQDYNLHAVDAYAHDSAVSAAVTTAIATDSATAITLVNAIKAAYNTHCSASNVHYNDDSTNTVTNADATDAATLYVVLNEAKADFSAHVISAPLGTQIKII